MPCRDEFSYSDCSHYQNRANLNARVACEALRNLEQLGKLGGLSNETRYWWREHKAADAIRVKREEAEKERRRVASKARAKLTKEELKALGL